MEGMFLKIENDGSNERLVNLTLIDVVHLNEQSKKATLWSGGVPIVSDSRIVYCFLKNPPEGVVIEPEETKKKESAVQAG